MSDNVVILCLHYEDGLMYLPSKFLFLEFLEGDRRYIVCSVGSSSSDQNQEE